MQTAENSSTGGHNNTEQNLVCAYKLPYFHANLDNPFDESQSNVGIVLHGPVLIDPLQVVVLEDVDRVFIFETHHFHSGPWHFKAY